MSYIHPWQVVALVVLVGFLIYRWRQRAPAGARPRGAVAKTAPAAGTSAGIQRPGLTAEEEYLELRQQAFATDPRRLGLSGELQPDDPYGVLMEMGIADSVVTLACFADGDARIYYRSGGGMVGGVSHESVRQAAKELIALAKTALPRMTRTTDYPLPGGDRVRFYVLTQRGVSTTETDRQALGESRSDLAPLFQSGQEVASRMRQVGEKRAQDAP